MWACAGSFTAPPRPRVSSVLRAFTALTLPHSSHCGASLHMKYRPRGFSQNEFEARTKRPPFWRQNHASHRPFQTANSRFLRSLHLDSSKKSSQQQADSVPATHTPESLESYRLLVKINDWAGQTFFTSLKLDILRGCLRTHARTHTMKSRTSIFPFRATHHFCIASDV